MSSLMPAIFLGHGNPMNALSRNASTDGWAAVRGTVQLSIDERQPPEFHYDLGRRLAALREEGVLIIGSGNLVHNLHAYAWGSHEVRPFEWAVRFEERVRKLLLKDEVAPLIRYEELGQDAMLSVPTPDHYLPLLYILGLRREVEQISYPVQGVDGGSVSMLAMQIG